MNSYTKRIVRICACDRDFRPRDPEQTECAGCLERRAKRGRVIPPKALRERELERARDLRARERRLERRTSKTEGTRTT